MRPLTEDETKVVFEKLYKFIGKNVKSLIDKDDSAYVLRLHKQRVFFVREDIMRRATSISRDNLQSFGTCLVRPGPSPATTCGNSQPGGGRVS
mmetsp:Transcript_58604/g.186830  ORF Transcript_58604/g.186830 Transcript_58604/m.186830 type:complete len:93 (+) Transcript_58604:91-369(+)